jgi:hypothetical protein
MAIELVERLKPTLAAPDLRNWRLVELVRIR